MGIYDRDYYRKEGPSYIGSFMDHGKVCKWIILVNVGCFLLQQVSFTPPPPGDEEDPVAAYTRYYQQSQPFTDFMRLDAPAVCNGQLWRLVTHAFVHGSIMHILFNMLFLWWFGTDVEDLYGRVEFLTFYLTAAVAGGLGFVLAWKVGLQESKYAVGASGAIMAVMVVCAMHYPTRIILIFGLVPIPIWLFVVIAVAKDWMTLVSQERTGTAVTGHLGGAAFGFVYYRMQWKLSSMFSGIKSMQWRKPRTRLRVYREEEEPEPAIMTQPPRRDSDEMLEAKLDAVLEKVARSGQASLSESEKQILLRASEIYKRKKP
jgi:membrane associated rhomboid family serine protease